MNNALPLALACLVFVFCLLAGFFALLSSVVPS